MKQAKSGFKMTQDMQLHHRMKLLKERRTSAFVDTARAKRSSIASMKQSKPSFRVASSVGGGHLMALTRRQQ